MQVRRQAPLLMISSYPRDIFYISTAGNVLTGTHLPHTGHQQLLLVIHSQSKALGRPGYIFKQAHSSTLFILVSSNIFYNSLKMISIQYSSLLSSGLYPGSVTS